MGGGSYVAAIIIVAFLSSQGGRTPTYIINGADFSIPVRLDSFPQWTTARPPLQLVKV